MLLEITLTEPPATDLGFLLHKHPARCQRFELSFGAAHVFYPEAGDARCTAAMLVEVDPVALVRRRGGRSLTQYVNDRPYAASSFLSVAIAQVYRTALGGRCAERPELVARPLALEARVSVVDSGGGDDVLRRLFEPLGYAVNAPRRPLDESFPEWGPSPYSILELSAEVRLADLLSHLYVLIPALDREKHYWVGQDEVEKLLRRGEGWLAAHPERDFITRRYLEFRRSLADRALAALEGEMADPDAEAERRDAEEQAVEERVRLHDQRIGAVLSVLRQSGARRVVDVGCGEGRLLGELLRDDAFDEVAGVDVSHRALERAARRLRLDRLPPERRERVKLIHGSLVYRDRRLEGYDAAAVVEVIEHLDPYRLAAFERALFGSARPPSVVLTTPNAEYNVRFEGLPAGSLRHRDHRFEWSREEFHRWAGDVAERNGYAVRFLPVGPEDPEVGPPTQMAVFSR